MHKGFSLIELLVVVAIIAILTAIAAPVYVQYSIRAKIMSGYDVVWGVLQYLESSYNTSGKFPTTATIGGSSFVTSAGNCASLPVSFPGVPLSNLAYCIAPDGKGVGMNVIFTLAALGSNTDLYFGLRDINGAMIRVCGGNSGGADGAIVTTYRPNNCTCKFIGTGYTTSGFMSTGSGC